MASYADSCECRGQCGRHPKQCITIFGNAHLFDDHVDEPAYARHGAGKRICAQCAPSYDPNRKARERRYERALSESQQPEGVSILEWYAQRNRRR